jgi:endogenous inhibitor of DNA gyrase (YacG/DUF329 family)
MWAGHLNYERDQMLFQVECDQCGKKSPVLRIDETANTPTGRKPSRIGNDPTGNYIIDCPKCGMRSQPPKTAVK